MGLRRKCGTGVQFMSDCNSLELRQSSQEENRFIDLYIYLHVYIYISDQNGRLQKTHLTIWRNIRFHLREEAMGFRKTWNSFGLDFLGRDRWRWHLLTDLEGLEIVSG